MVFPKTKPIPETHHDILVDRFHERIITNRLDKYCSVIVFWCGRNVNLEG